MAGGRRFRPQDITEILSRYKYLVNEQKMGVGAACAEIARDYDRTQDTVYNLVRRFIPSVEAADSYLKANALRLAMRVVRKANVDQSIDILSRSNIGALAPAKTESGGGGGFFLSVQADTCGAVKIGIVQGQGAMEGQQGLQNPPSEPLRGSSGYALQPLEVEHEAIEEEKAPLLTEPGVPHPNQGTFGRFSKPKEEWSKRHQLEIERNREKLRLARVAAAPKYSDVKV